MDMLMHVMLYVDVKTLKSACLTTKHIDYEFWKKRYKKDKLPLLTRYTTIKQWLTDHQIMKYVMHLSKKLYWMKKCIKVRYNYTLQRYRYHMNAYIHDTLMRLLPIEIQQQIVSSSANVSLFQELILDINEDHYTIQYCDDYRRRTVQTSYQGKKLLTLLVHLFYYCPQVEIYIDNKRWY